MGKTKELAIEIAEKEAQDVDDYDYQYQQWLLTLEEEEPNTPPEDDKR